MVGTDSSGVAMAMGLVLLRISALHKSRARGQFVPLILDVSPSMQATDVHPSRKERAKEEIRNFIVSRGPLVDRIGLVTFSSTSLILSYLTSDAENILFYLDYMDLTG